MACNVTINQAGAQQAVLVVVENDYTRCLRHERDKLCALVASERTYRDVFNSDDEIKSELEVIRAAIKDSDRRVRHHRRLVKQQRESDARWRRRLSDDHLSRAFVEENSLVPLYTRFLNRHLSNRQAERDHRDDLVAAQRERLRQDREKARLIKRWRRELDAEKAERTKVVVARNATRKHVGDDIRPCHCPMCEGVS